MEAASAGSQTWLAASVTSSRQEHHRRDRSPHRTNACPSRAQKDSGLLSACGEEGPSKGHGSPVALGSLAAGLRDPEKVVCGDGILAFREGTLQKPRPWES